MGSRAPGRCWRRVREDHGPGVTPLQGTQSVDLYTRIEPDTIIHLKGALERADVDIDNPHLRRPGALFGRSTPPTHTSTRRNLQVRRHDGRTHGHHIWHVRRTSHWAPEIAEARGCFWRSTRGRCLCGCVEYFEEG